MEEKERKLKEKEMEVSKFEKTKMELLGQMNAIREQMQDSANFGHTEQEYKKLIENLEFEVDNLRKEHVLDIQKLNLEWEEERAVETHLLDTELERLREERVGLLDRLRQSEDVEDKMVHPEEYKKLAEEQEDLVAKFEEERQK